MRLVILLGIFFTTSFLNAQNGDYVFGELRAVDKKMSYYEKDSRAEAVVLFDIGNTKFDDALEGGYEIKFERKKRVKIFEQKGLDQAQIEIPFYKDGYGKTERVTKIEGFTYNEIDGNYKQIALDPNTIFEEKKSENWYTKKFAMPAVKKGSIIEFRYTLISPFHFNLPDWIFQSNIPTIHSRYVVGMIPFYEYVYIAQGISKFDQYTKAEGKVERLYGTIEYASGANAGNGFNFRDIIHTYIMNDVAAMKDEAYITSVDDYIMKLDFQLASFTNENAVRQDIVTTWEKLNEHLLKHSDFGKFLNKSKGLAAGIISTLDLKQKSQLEQAQIIIKYVKDNFTWNGISSKYAQQGPKSLLKTNAGSSAELNLLLISLLRQAKIKADPVVISTRNHGKIKADYPFSHFFNYVVVQVNTTEPFLTDATESMLDYNRLPPRCINEQGLVVKAKTVEWLPLEQEILSQEKYTIRSQINLAEATIKSQINLETDQYASYYYKSSFSDDQEKLTPFFEEKSDGKIIQLSSKNNNSHHLPYQVTFNSIKDIELIGDNIIISPLLKFPPQKNKLTQKYRNYPVDFIYAQSLDYSSEIEIPNGYKIESLPDDYDKETDIVALHIKYLEEDGKLKVNAGYQLKKAVYTQREYSGIKAFYNINALSY